MNKDLTALYEQFVQQLSTGLGAATIIAIGLLGLLLVVLVAAWLFLPFAIIGTKARIDRVLVKLDAITTQLSALNARIADLRSALPDAEPRIKFETSDATKTQQSIVFDLEKKDRPPG
jgi:hypothetical protein